MSRFVWGSAVYLPLIAIWFALEMTSIFWKGCPWPTLSRTAWDAEDRWSWAQLVFLVGLAVLMVHIVTGWPYRSRP